MPDPNEDEIPTPQNLPVALDVEGVRSEFDGLGALDVPAIRYWGAQRQRSLLHFSIDNDHMPIEVHRTYGLVTEACAPDTSARARILGDGCEKFLESSLRGTLDNQERMAKDVSESLMLVTSPSPLIGSQNAAHIAEDAPSTGTTRRAAAIASGHVTAERFDTVVDPSTMVGHGVGGA